MILQAQPEQCGVSRVRDRAPHRVKCEVWLWVYQMCIDGRAKSFSIKNLISNYASIYLIFQNRILRIQYSQIGTKMYTSGTEWYSHIRILPFVFYCLMIFFLNLANLHNTYVHILSDF